MNRPMPRTTMAAEGLPRRPFTVAELEAMVAAGILEEDERIELIGGEVVPMSPKGNQHEVVKAALIVIGYRACLKTSGSSLKRPSASRWIPISSRISCSIRRRAV